MSPEFKPIVEKLSAEKLQAEFIPNECTKPGSLYGYYYIKRSSLGPVIAEFDDFSDDDGIHSDMLRIRVRKSNTSAYCFAGRASESEFKLGKQFIESLPTVPSRLSSHEGFMLDFHFLDSPKERATINKHYLNTRVMYDTMYDTAQSGRGKRIYDVNGGYVVCATFDNKEVEIIKIKNITQRNKHNMLDEIMQITIPSVNLTDKFMWHFSAQDNLVYNMAQQLLQLPERKIASNITGASFSRWDSAYDNLMKQIKNKREKAK